MKPGSYLTALTLFLVLTGCATIIDRRAEKEQSAWVVAKQESKRVCLKGGTEENIKKESAVAFVKCHQKIVQKNVMPSAFFPSLVKNMNAKSLSDAEAWEQGKISKEEWLAKNKSREEWYAKEHEKKIAAHARAHPEESMNTLERVGKAMQGDGVQANKAQYSNAGLDDNHVYDESECIGPVIMGRCHGSIIPNRAYHPTCHGTWINGQCTGPMF